MAKVERFAKPVLVVLLVLWAVTVLIITPMEAKITLLLAGSLAFFAVAVYYFSSRLVRRSVLSKMSPMLLLALLLGSIWSLRLATGLFGLKNPELSAIAADSSLVNLTGLEELFNSLIHALQTFSMDEDYTAYIISGKTMVRELYGAGDFGQDTFGFYASLLNVLAPIAGGAIILDIIASFMPKLWLAFSRFAIWKDKYYFSELNEGSLALAKNYMQSEKHPAIIFADIDDSDDEKEAEMLTEAKLLGAICIKDDLSHIKVNEWGRKKFFLIDEDEEENLKAFTALTDPANSFIKKSEIFLFVNSDAYVQIERNVRNKLIDSWNLVDYEKIRNDAEKKLKDDEKKKAEGNPASQDENKEDDFEKSVEKLEKKIVKRKEEKTSYKQLPTVYPVRCYRNLVSNLLCDVPLYEPLIGKKRNSEGIVDLTVTILGSGDIGTEMFLTTYWMGQILNCHLHINVLSKESKDEFWNKIDYVNPEIKHTTIDEDPILQIYPHGNKAEVYCHVNYCQCDLKSSKFIERLNPGEKDSIVNTDYFFVCLGSDEDNISVANTIKSYIGQYHLTPAYVEKHKERENGVKEGSPGPDTIIAYVVYDDALTEALNATYQKVNEDELKDDLEKKLKKIEDEQKNKPLKKMDLIKRLKKTLFDELIEPKKDDEDSKQIKSDGSTKDIYMRAVGSLGEVYSVNNVEMSKYKILVGEIHGTYAAKQDKVADDNKKRATDPKNDYEHWASLARAMHRRYKMYSAGLINFSVTDNKYEFKIKQARSKYKELAESTDDKDKQKLNDLAWLEHRRWNAFTRIKGYRHTDDFATYYETLGREHKQMELKLHPCLVECDKRGPMATFSKDHKKTHDVNDLDYLDKLIYDIYDESVRIIKNKADKDKSENDEPAEKAFKTYDYPKDDFNND